MNFLHKIIIVSLIAVSMNCYATKDISSNTAVIPDCIYASQDGLGICIQNAAGDLNGLGFHFTATTVWSSGFVDRESTNGDIISPSYYYVHTEFPTSPDTITAVSMEVSVIDNQGNRVYGCTNTVTPANNHLKFQFVKNDNGYYCQSIG